MEDLLIGSIICLTSNCSPWFWLLTLDFQYNTNNKPRSKSKPHKTNATRWTHMNWLSLSCRSRVTCRCSVLFCCVPDLLDISLWSDDIAIAIVLCALSIVFLAYALAVLCLLFIFISCQAISLQSFLPKVAQVKLQLRRRGLSLPTIFLTIAFSSRTK